MPESVEKMSRSLFSVILDSKGGLQLLRELGLRAAVTGRLLSARTDLRSASIDGLVVSDSACDSAHVGETDDIFRNVRIPNSSWIRTKLGNIIQLQYGKSLPKKLRNDRGSIPTYGSNGQVGVHDEPLVNEPCVVVGRKGSSGAANLVTSPSWPIDTTYYVLAPKGTHLEFIFLLLSSLRLSRFDRSTAIPGLNRVDAYAQTILVPPLFEQRRIVDKFDAFDAFLNQLEVKEKVVRDLGSRLTKASLEALTTAETPEEFALAWKRVSENFDTLIDRSEKVEDLRRAIRDFALRGRLTKQVSSERSGRSLLTKIEGHRTEQIRLKRSRRVVLPDSIESTDEPFPIPPNWAWSRLGHLCWKVADGPHFSPSYVAKEIGVPFLSGRNIKVEGFDLTNVKYVSKDDHDSFCSRTKPEPGDVLYTKGGTTGIALVNTLDFEFSVWVHVAVLKVAQDLVVPAYVAMALNSPHCYAQSQTLTHGIGNRDLGLTRMVQISLPLPPFEEQSRIVTQVEHMLKICDLLENRLRQAEELAAKFAESVVRGVTA